MKEVNKMTSYELWIYGIFSETKVTYIQFDDNANPHIIKTYDSLRTAYEEWTESHRAEQHLFTALIRWFTMNGSELVIRLEGADGELHYEA